MTESDGVSESVGGSMRTALMIAGQVGQQAANLIRQRLEEQQRVSEQRAREMQARYDAERAAARAQVAVVHRPEWWERARAEQVGQVWETATAWRDQDPDIDRAARVMEEQVRERYGLDADLMARGLRDYQNNEAFHMAETRADYEQARAWAMENDPELWAAHIDKLRGVQYPSDEAIARDELIMRWRAHSGAQVDGDDLRAEAQRDRENAEAVMAEPVATEAEAQEVEERVDELMDDAERRQALAERLDAAGIGAEAKEARLVAHDAKGVPAAEAVSGKTKGPKARRSRTATRQRDQSLSR